MFDSGKVYKDYLLYKQDMLLCEEESLRELSLDDFISLKLYRDTLTTKRGCYKMKPSLWGMLKFWKDDLIFCSFKYWEENYV